MYKSNIYKPFHLIMEDPAIAKLKFDNSDGVDIDKAKKWYRSEVKSYIESYHNLNDRDKNPFKAIISAFNIGLDKQSAIAALKAINLATHSHDEMNVADRVERVYSWWKSKGSPISTSFLKQSKEQRQAYLKSLFV